MREVIPTNETAAGYFLLLQVENLLHWKKSGVVAFQ